MAAERVDPLGPLVVAVQGVLPGEADAAVHLDRALAGSDRGLGRCAFAASGRDVGAARRPRPRTTRPSRRASGRAPSRRTCRRAGARRPGRCRSSCRTARGLRVLDAELERLLRDADRLGSQRGEQPQPTGSKSPSSAAVPARASSAASRPRLRASRPPPRPWSCPRAARSTVSRCGTSPSSSSDQASSPTSGRAGTTTESSGRGRVERPAEPPRTAAPRRRSREPAAAALLGHRDAEPAELGAAPRAARSGFASRSARASRRSSSCSSVKAKSHPHRLLGRPSTRSAMMLRRISDVPASIVFPRERSCWCCQ